MSDEYDSWRRYEDAKAFKNKLAEIDQLKDRIEELEETINKFMDDWEDGGPMCKPFREVMKIENESI